MASSPVPDEMLEAACAYARMGWRVFPIHTVVDGKCSCGKPHADGKGIGKHPRTRQGFKEATTDQEQIRRWWTRWQGSNIGIATGGGLVVIDIDGSEGAHEFQELVATHGAPPATLVAQTGNGVHAFYRLRPESPEVRSSARGHVHVRGEGGYVVAAPSRHASGRSYQWIRKNPVAELPDWLRQWSQGYEVTAKPATASIGPLPAYLQKQNQHDPGKSLESSLRATYSASEEARLISALSVIPSNDYSTWFTVGMSLKDLGWERPDGTDAGFDIWVAWSETCSEKFSLAACETKWQSFKRSGVSVGTIYHMAREKGWNPAPAPASSPAGSLNGHGATGGANGHAALPAAFLAAQTGAIIWPDVNENGKPRPTMTNAKVAIMQLGVDCRYDLFHNRMLVAGELINKWNSSELSDHVVSMLRDHIRYRYQFDPGKQATQDAAEILCLGRRFDPVLDYLDGLTWDGKPRLDRWMATYLGAADTELNRAISRLSLLAAVRRVRHPGTKFDQIIILEGPQGLGKSEAIEILAGPENFSDQKILDVDDRKQQELTEGVWLYEIGELSGMRRAEIEHVKAFASRKVDRARPAYGRYTINQPRRTVFFASTNQDNYLQDDSGNRRFWPVKVARIDLDALRRDRDQLWAEANQAEASGASHMLPEALWARAHEEQEARMQSDTWVELIHNYLNMADKPKNDVSIHEVLCDNQFIQMRPDAVKQADTIKAGRILAQLKFVRYQKRTPDGARIWRYRR